jgi:hypothetical protein
LLIFVRPAQRSVPFGFFIVQASDATLATETCEELFTPDAPHIDLDLNGAEIIANGSVRGLFFVFGSFSIRAVAAACINATSPLSSAMPHARSAKHATLTPPPR